MPLSTIFQLYRGGQFYWRKKTSHVSKFREILKGSSPSSNNNPRHHGNKTHDKEGIAKILCQRNKFLLS
jgi:hypothetical protein